MIKVELILQRTIYPYEGYNKKQYNKEAMVL